MGKSRLPDALNHRFRAFFPCNLPHQGRQIYPRDKPFVTHRKYLQALIILFNHGDITMKRTAIAIFTVLSIALPAAAANLAIPRDAEALVAKPKSGDVLACAGIYKR